MVGDERIRLFCALRLPPETLGRLAGWAAELELRQTSRLVRRENLHVTLAFLGRVARRRVDDVACALRAAAEGVEPPAFRAVRYRETRSVGMVVLEDEDNRGATIADGLSSRLEGLGLFGLERRPWLPHVTVVRFRNRPRIDPDTPDLGRFVSSEATVTMSLLRPTGAQYADIESVALGG